MRFALIAHPRSGTTLFNQMLNSNPRIYHFGEILNPDLFIWSFFQHLEIVSGENSRPHLQAEWKKHLSQYFVQIDGLMLEAGKTHIGYNPKVPQVDAFYEFFAFLHREQIAVVHLIRQDRLSLACSMESMQWRAAHSVPTSGIVPYPKPKIHLDPQWLRSRVDWLSAQGRKCSDDSINSRYFRLFYEDLIDDGNRTDTEMRLSSLQWRPVDFGQCRYNREAVAMQSSRKM